MPLDGLETLSGAARAPTQIAKGSRAPFVCLN
jgi:hypothetical protein